MCVNTKGLAAPLGLPLGVRVVHVPITRGIDPLSDSKNVYRMARFFRAERFDIVHTMMPKSGLVGMLGASIARIPHRVHTFTGQVWATESGVKREMLKRIDWLMVRCATRVLADSPSQRAFLVSEGIASDGEIGVLAHGSICGVDVERFRRVTVTRVAARARLGIAAEETVLLFVGRLKKDKGVLDLAAAFSRLERGGRRVRLVFVGHDEENLAPLLGASSGVLYAGYDSEVQTFFSMADVLCLPSYREGFGSTLIEAGAAGLPVVASEIYGITDAVVDGQTGLLHAPGDVDGLADKLRQLVDDPQLRDRLGKNGYTRATELFRTDVVTGALEDFYLDLLRRVGRKPGRAPLR